MVKLERYDPPRPEKHHPLSYSYIRPFDSKWAPAHSGECGRAAGHLPVTPLFLPPTSAGPGAARKTRQAPCTPHRERIQPVQVAARQPATLRRACEAAAAPQTPHWSPKTALQRHHRAPLQPRTLLMQPPARQRGAGSRPWPGVLFSTRWSWFDAAQSRTRSRPRLTRPSLGGGAPLARGPGVRQPPRRRGPSPDRLDCAGLRPRSSGDAREPRKP